MKKELIRNGGYPTEIILYKNLTEKIPSVSNLTEKIPSVSLRREEFTKSIYKLVDEFLPAYFPDKKTNSSCRGDGDCRSELECVGEGSSCVALKDDRSGEIIKVFYPLFMTFSETNGHLVSEAPSLQEDVRTMLTQFLKSFAIAKEIFNIYGKNRKTTLTCGLWDSSVGLCLLYSPFGGKTIDESDYNLEAVLKDSTFEEILDRLEKCLGLFLKIAHDINQYHGHNYLVGDIKPSNLWEIHLDKNSVAAVRNIDYGSCFDILELIETINSERATLLQKGCDVDKYVEVYLGQKDDPFAEEPPIKEYIERKCKKMLSTQCFYLKDDLEEILYFCFGNFTDEEKIRAVKFLDLRALLILLVRFLRKDNGLRYYKDDPLEGESIISVFWTPKDVLSFLENEKASFATYNLYYNLYVLLEESANGLNVVNVIKKDGKSKPMIEPAKFLDCERFTQIIKETIWIIQELRNHSPIIEPNDNDNAKRLQVQLETHNLKDFDYLLEDEWKISNIIDYSEKVYKSRGLKGLPIRSSAEIIENLLFETES